MLSSPSSSFVFLHHKEEEGSCRCLLRCAVAQRNKTKGRRRWRQHSAIPREEEKGNGSNVAFFAALQRNKRRGGRRWHSCRHLLCCAFLCYTKRNVAAVAFFALLSCCSATPQKKEEGDGSKVVVTFLFLFFLATHRRTNKTNKQDADLGPVWVLLQLQL